MGCYHQFCCCCCCHKWRIPIDIRQPVSFGIALVIEFFFCEVYMLVSIMFLIMYVGICTYFWSCIEDLSTIVEHHSGDIKQRIMMKRLLVQFITLHMDLYKYSFRKEYRFLNIIIEHLAILPHFFAIDKVKKVSNIVRSLPWHIRMMTMFEDIISAPIFFQLPLFGLHLAVILFKIEHVRFFLQFFNDFFSKFF